MTAFTRGGIFVAVLLALQASRVEAVAHITLQEAVQKVVSSNPEVQAKWHTYMSSSGEVDVARAGFLPKLDYTYGSGKEFLRQPGVADKSYSRNGHTLTLNQVLYDGFGTSADVNRLDKARLTRYFELIDAAESAALEAGRAYYDVIRYRLLLLLAENNYVEHRASYEQLLRRAQSGAGRRVDVEHAASRLALAELNLNTEAANLHDVMARFQRLVGEPPPPVMFPPSGLTKGYPGTEEDALRLALRRNPALRASLENVESAQHDVELRRAALHPRIDFRMRNESTDNYQGTIGNRTNNVAEVLLSFNIFNGGADMARQRVFAERKSVALDQRDKVCRDTRQTLAIAYNDVERLKVQLGNLELQVSSIERTRDAYKAQFNIGQRSLLDLLDTENELLNARRTAVNSDMDLGIAYLRTQAGIGQLMEFLGVRPSGLDDAILSHLEPGEEICPAKAPGHHLVDLEALTARAMAVLESNKPVAPAAPASPGPAAAPPDAAPLSSPPPMPPARPAAAAAALREPPPLRASAERGDSAATGAARIGGVVSAADTTGAPGGLMPASTTGATSTTRQSGDKTDTMSDGLAERLAAWVAAWSSGNFERYSAFYAPSFLPAGGGSREEWAQQRRARLSGHVGIAIGLKDLQLRGDGTGAMIAEFIQDYRSDRFVDTTRKLLRWTRVGGDWMISEEIARPMGRITAQGRGAK